MKILKVYDTIQLAKIEAEKHYRDYLDNGLDVIFRTPIRLDVGENTYMFVGRNAELLGRRFDRIDDCTTLGIPARIKAYEYPMKEG